MRTAFSTVLAACLWSATVAPASSILETPLERRIELADAVFEGEVVNVTPFQQGENGPILTRTILKVGKVYKGTLPPAVRLTHRGGVVRDRGEMDGFSPSFRQGETRLVFAALQPDGSLGVSLGVSGAIPLPSLAQTQRSPLAAAQAGAGTSETGLDWRRVLRSMTLSGPLAGADLVSHAASLADLQPVPHRAGAGPALNGVSTATNLFADAEGISARFLAADRGEAIPYYVDADALPSGLSQLEALKAVSDALWAWSSVTTLKFTFAGMRSFGTAAANVNVSDGALRIQLHDLYQFIGTSGEVLGRGGIHWAKKNLASGWTLGGNVQGNDFHKAVAGWVVLQHTSPFMRNASNFTEVLCHELGHALSLNHSSNDPGETNPTLKEAIMYYTAHGDGRGARLNSFDTNVIRQVHPALNTPPYCFDRFIDAITTMTNRPGMNVIQFTGYDLQSSNLAVETTLATSDNGSFTITGTAIGYTASGYFNGTRFDPASNWYYDALYARVSDGTNASPFATVNVISFNPDAYYEGIPDDWRLTFFGSKNPSAGPNRHARQDFDGDGYDNLTEYRLGSDPTDPSSNLRITSITPARLEWQAKPYEVYEVRTTTNFLNWTRLRVTTPTNALAEMSITSPNGSQFFRVLKVP